MNYAMLEFWCCLVQHKHVVTLAIWMPRVTVGVVREFRDRPINVVGQWRVIVHSALSLQFNFDEGSCSNSQVLPAKASYWSLARVLSLLAKGPSGKGNF